MEVTAANRVAPAHSTYVGLASHMKRTSISTPRTQLHGSPASYSCCCLLPNFSRCAWYALRNVFAAVASCGWSDGWAGAKDH